ncbi:MAG: PilZ domain-containing protein [Gammaproteobacteria bacterium]|nr:PilZ domain-containing protein [Gammaproteobacteria bacterium]MDH5801088.1 PilZ domain-containing protein [Gammaproteobacteria bacterium]
MVQYSEKRDYFRINTDAELTYRQTGQSETHQGRCINLSGAGVLFSAHTDYAPGTILDINLTPEKILVAPFNAIIEVLRTEAADDESYLIAGRFTETH